MEESQFCADLFHIWKCQKLVPVRIFKAYICFWNFVGIMFSIFSLLISSKNLV